MFIRASQLRFGAADTPARLNAAFAEMRRAVTLLAGDQEADTLTEVLFSALHGPVTLSRAGRLRPGYDSERLDALVEQFTAIRRR